MFLLFNARIILSSLVEQRALNKMQRNSFTIYRKIRHVLSPLKRGFYYFWNKPRGVVNFCSFVPKKEFIDHFDFITAILWHFHEINSINERGKEWCLPIFTNRWRFHKIFHWKSRRIHKWRNSLFFTFCLFTLFEETEKKYDWNL